MRKAVLGLVLAAAMGAGMPSAARAEEDGVMSDRFLTAMIGGCAPGISAYASDCVRFATDMMMGMGIFLGSRTACAEEPQPDLVVMRQRIVSAARKTIAQENDDKVRIQTFMREFYGPWLRDLSPACRDAAIDNDALRQNMGLPRAGADAK